MGLGSALNVVVSGLRFNQAQTQVIAGNVANADTPGYTRKTVTGQDLVNPSGHTTGVNANQIQRELDLATQQLYWQNVPGGVYANHVADITARLDTLLGAPGDPTSLDAVYNTFTSALQNLATSPEDFTLRSSVLSDAQVMAQRLNTVSEGIQDIRDEQEAGIANTVNRINELLGELQDLNTEIVALSTLPGAGPGMLDDRDRLLEELATLIDIKVTERPDQTVSVHTTSGYTLFDILPAQLTFDGSGVTHPGGVYDPDPNVRGVGTVAITTIGGSSIDLIEQGAIGSGLLAAQIQARDDILVEAQSQMDTLAEALSLALSNETVSGTAQTVGVQDGFDLDLTNLKAGNVATLDYTLSGTPTTISFVRVESASSLPLDNNVTANPDDTVVGIDFSGGFASVVTQIQTALGGSFTVSDQGGNVLRVLDDGAAATIDISSFSASVTNDAFVDQGTGIPFFVDGTSGKLYTGELDNQAQKTGFSSRIQVNQALIDNPDGLVIYQSSPQTSAGDNTRPTALFERLTDVQQQFSAGVGFGSEAVPYTGTISGFMSQVVAHRASEAQVAERFAEGQTIVVNNLQERLYESAKVDIDQELALLVEVQNAYAANARVLQVIEEMFDALIRA